MTSPISSLSHAIALLRLGLAKGKVGTKLPAGHSQKSHGRVASKPDRVAGGALANLSKRLEELRKLSPDQRRRKALRLLIESALVDEFGEALALDPALADLVERVSGAIEGDAESKPLLDEALEELLAP